MAGVQQPTRSPVVHNSIQDAIRRRKKHQMHVNGWYVYIDQDSWEHLVNYLDRQDDAHQVNELEIKDLNSGSVLCRFFARSNTTLTKVNLSISEYCGSEELSLIIESFYTNTTVTDLSIINPAWQRDSTQQAVNGRQLCGLLQNMLQLQRLDFSGFHLGVEGIRALLPGLRFNRTLKELILAGCRMQDEGLRRLAVALFGNSILEVLCLYSNGITSNGLPDITRMIESMQLEKIDFIFCNDTLIKNNHANRKPSEEYDCTGGGMA